MPERGFTPEMADTIYEQVLSLHEGLEREESHALNARLVLALAAELGPGAALDRALSAAAGTPDETPR